MADLRKFKAANEHAVIAAREAFIEFLKETFADKIFLCEEHLYWNPFTWRVRERWMKSPNLLPFGSASSTAALYRAARAILLEQEIEIGYPEMDNGSSDKEVVSASCRETCKYKDLYEALFSYYAHY